MSLIIFAISIGIILIGYGLALLCSRLKNERFAVGLAVAMMLASVVGMFATQVYLVDHPAPLLARYVTVYSVTNDSDVLGVNEVDQICTRPEAEAYLRWLKNHGLDSLQIAAVFSYRTTVSRITGKVMGSSLFEGKKPCHHSTGGLA